MQLEYNPIGFMQLAEKPNAEQLAQYYADKYYQSEAGSYRHEYSQDELQYFEVKWRQRYEIVKQLLKRDVGKLLDVGCGEGHILKFFHEAGWTVEGIDYSSAGLESINPAYGKFLSTGDIYELLNNRSKEARHYDVIWLQNVLEHVLEPVELLKFLKGLLTDDGVLVITVPNDESAYQKELYEKNYVTNEYWIAAPDHISYFNHESLKKIVEATGWQLQRLLADFPIDWYLANPRSNYVEDPSSGPCAHAARVELELLINNSNDYDKINRFYESMAHLGLGRQLVAFLKA